MKSKMLACLCLGVPVLLLILCHNESSRATCQRRDPKTRWTDRCPLPVLIFSLMCATSIALMVLLRTDQSIMPVFGTCIRGPIGTAIAVSTACVMAYLAWGTYRLQPAAWWGALIVTVVGTANMLVTFAMMDLSQIYVNMEMPAEQIKLMRDADVFDTLSRWAPALCWAGGIGSLGYLLFLRRYFFGAKVPTP